MFFVYFYLFYTPYVCYRMSVGLKNTGVDTLKILIVPALILSLVIVVGILPVKLNLEFSISSFKLIVDKSD